MEGLKRPIRFIDLTIYEIFFHTHFNFLMLMPAPHLKILYKDCKRKKGELRHMFKKSRTELAAERLTV